MANNYGTRYIPLDQFKRHCQALNVTTDNQELEYYEKTGVMLPTARVTYPEEYVVQDFTWSLRPGSDYPNMDRWPELQRLSERPRIVLEQYADLQDDELPHPFDREMTRNSFLVRPTAETYRPWSTYTVSVTLQDRYQLKRPTVEHYYSYWQVYQLQYVQQYPDLYHNRALLDHIPSDIKQRFLLPRAPNQETLRDFKGMRNSFDALSFWIAVSDRERKRTFASVPEKDGIRRLDPTQLAAYRSRLAKAAVLTQTRFGMSIENQYAFLAQLMELHSAYRRDERHSLSEELKNDVFRQTQLIEASSGVELDAVAEQLGRRSGTWTQRDFRHLDNATKERDEARDALTYSAKQHSEELTKLKIASPKHPFLESEIDAFLDYCETKGPSVLIPALSGMVATEEQYAQKFRDVTRYTNLKNVLNATEFLLKDFAANGSITIGGKPTLCPTIQAVMKNEAWITLFNKKVGSKLTSANNLPDFFGNLNQLLGDPELVKSEEAYMARAFLVTYLARNLTAHIYPNDDSFYGEKFGEMLQAAICVLLYSWQIAKREGWV